MAWGNDRSKLGYTELWFLLACVCTYFEQEALLPTQSIFGYWKYSFTNLRKMVWSWCFLFPIPFLSHGEVNFVVLFCFVKHAVLLACACALHELWSTGWVYFTFFVDSRISEFKGWLWDGTVRGEALKKGWIFDNFLVKNLEGEICSRSFEVCWVSPLTWWNSET